MGIGARHMYCRVCMYCKTLARNTAPLLKPHMPGSHRLIRVFMLTEGLSETCVMGTGGKIDKRVKFMCARQFVQYDYGHSDENIYKYRLLLGPHTLDYNTIQQYNDKPSSMRVL